MTESAPASERGMAGAGFQLAMVTGWMTCKVKFKFVTDPALSLHPSPLNLRSYASEPPRRPLPLRYALPLTTSPPIPASSV